MLDVFALSGLEWVYDKVEGRYGRLAAWLVTTAIALALIAIVVGVLIFLL